MIPWFQYNIWQIGPAQIQVWGFFVALGMLMSIVILWKRLDALQIYKEEFLNQALWMIILGVIFARLFHVFFYEPTYFLANPVDVVKIWHGGLSSFGGFVGAAIGFVYFYRKKIFPKKLLWSILDVFGFAALFGWIVGRIGCFMIHDHMGRPCNCFIAIDTPDGPRLEMALLEIIGLLPLALLFFIKRKKSMPDGWFLSVLFVYYGVLRFILDFFRATDITQADARYLGLTPGQYFAILMFVFGIYIWKKKK